MQNVTHLSPIALLLALTIVLACQQQSAECKLGEDFNLYQKKLSASFLPAGKSINGQSTNYRFALKIGEEQQDASPGYACGLTVTVENGKVIGQSMAIRLGTNVIVGTALAAGHGFAFANEAIGRALPSTKQSVENEYKVFSQAVNSALLGSPQNIRYPGYKGLITLSADGTGNLIIAATRDPTSGNQNAVPGTQRNAAKR